MTAVVVVPGYEPVRIENMAMLEQMNIAVAWEPVIDRVFPLDGTADAYEYLASGRHFGKVVIRV